VEFEKRGNSILTPQTSNHWFVTRNIICNI